MQDYCINLLKLKSCKNSKEKDGFSSAAMDVRMIKEYDDITYKAVIMPVINA